MTRSILRWALGLSAAMIASASQGALISVNAVLSSFGTAPVILGLPPSDVLNSTVTNTGQQGFDEAQGVLTTVAHGIDGGGTIPVGTLVDSHMIFFNQVGGGTASHLGVEWTFDGIIIGVMSDSGGTLEAASTFELGNPLTNYTVGAAGEVAPYPARGLEGGDSYLIIGPSTIRVNMNIGQPGDWIRVVTQVPEPATLALLALGLLGVGVGGLRCART
jgi:hypothetical protein